MPHTAITVENLSKRYLIGHHATDGARYHSLRETLVRTARSFARKTKNLLLGAPIIEGSHIEEFWALKDVSFNIHLGDRVGIIGRNGAGKSTLLKILSRITSPTHGRICIKGRMASLLEVGTGFHPELTGRENIYLNSAIMGMSHREIQRKFDEIVDFAEVERFLDTPVKRYSSGMYVRLAFAVAAHIDPEILVVDEVLAVGDASFQKKCLGKMEDAGKEGRTVLFVSHNMSAVRALCKRSIVLESGSVVFQGEVAEGVAWYLSSTESAGGLFRVWKPSEIAPANTFVQLCSVRLCNAEDALLTSITSDMDIYVTIEFLVKTDNARAGFTLVVYDDEGSCVFSSINNRDAAYATTLEIGRYRTYCKLPKNFFNNRIYSISLNMFGNHFSESHMVQEVLRFEVGDSQALRGDYHGGFSGVIRPDLAWNTKKYKGLG